MGSGMEAASGSSRVLNRNKEMAGDSQKHIKGQVEAENCDHLSLPPQLSTGWCRPDSSCLSETEFLPGRSRCDPNANEVCAEAEKHLLCVSSDYTGTQGASRGLCLLSSEKLVGLSRDCALPKAVEGAVQGLSNHDLWACRQLLIRHTCQLSAGC